MSLFLGCWHRFEWGDLFEVLLEGQHYVMNVAIGEAKRYSETRQRGKCKKCGLVRERVVAPGIRNEK